VRMPWSLGFITSTSESEPFQYTQTCFGGKEIALRYEIKIEMPVRGHTAEIETMAAPHPERDAEPR
jgi:hypothetical protein